MFSGWVYLRHTLIPSTDDLLVAKFEFEGLSAIPGGVKLISIRQRACSTSNKGKTF